MQDLASEFSKIFRGWYLRTLTAGGGNPLPHPTPSPAFDRARGTSAPVLGPKPWSPPLNFSVVVVPLNQSSLPQNWFHDYTAHHFSSFIFSGVC